MKSVRDGNVKTRIFVLGVVKMRVSSNAAIVKVIYARSVQVQQSVRGWIVSKYVAMIATVSLKWIPPRRNVESVSTRAARNVVGLGIKQVAMWSVKAAEAFFSLRLKRKM
mmetsp:Transcript_23023/g.35344  ORF Transcript_23023/g.35344 Transcript_23023/m.35344 type:complete len:110 (+) Transcript_23023:925-1254(+)